jgi:hypothetical protein
VGGPTKVSPLLVGLNPRDGEGVDEAGVYQKSKGDGHYLWRAQRRYVALRTQHGGPGRFNGTDAFALGALTGDSSAFERSKSNLAGSAGSTSFRHSPLGEDTGGSFERSNHMKRFELER